MLLCVQILQSVLSLIIFFSFDRIVTGKQGLDVNVKLNRELHIVQDLLKQEIPLSISAELRGTIDFESSFKFNAPFYNEIEIAGFSVVANPANVNSTGGNLNSKGDSEVNLWFSYV